jgi:hypothetical protein
VRARFSIVMFNVDVATKVVIIAKAFWQNKPFYRGGIGCITLQ